MPDQGVQRNKPQDRVSFVGSGVTGIHSGEGSEDGVPSGETEGEAGADVSSDIV